MSVNVTITSDFICPWCYIGATRLSAAIAMLPDNIDVSVNWQPYELNPTMPEEGIDRKSYRTHKFGSWAYSQVLDRQTQDAAQSDNLVFNYEKISRTPNSFSAHRLNWLAAQYGKQQEVSHSILAAYFTEGWDIGKKETLVRIAGACGMDLDEVTHFLEGEEGRNEVRALINKAFDNGVQGVPEYNIEGFIISGAQSLIDICNAIVRIYQQKLQNKDTSHITTVRLKIREKSEMPVPVDLR